MSKKNVNRKFERLSALILATVYNPENASETFRAALIDISSGGVAFESYAEFFVDDYVVIRMIYKDELLIIINGEIKRKAFCIGGLQYGMEFSKLSAQDKRSLRKMLSDLKRNG